MPVNGFNAGWSSLVAREAHNLEVGGSNPPPATIRLCSARTELRRDCSGNTLLKSQKQDASA